MARRRMIDPEFFLDEGLAKLTPHARLLYIGSWTIADDRAATFPNRPEWIKAQLFPYEDIETEKIIDELVKANKFVLFENGNKKYIYIKNFLNFQKIEKPSQQKHPIYPNGNRLVGEYSGNITSPLPPEDKLSKVKISKVNRETFPHLKDEKFLNNLCSYLDGRKKRATEHAIMLILKKLHLHTVDVAIKMLENSIMNGWQGIFDLKNEDKPKKELRPL